MGLGPKYEGQFIPPAMPQPPPNAGEEMMAYTREVERYIQQLHDQLQVSFQKAEEVINQIIYQGDGDGGYTVGAETEEAGEIITSTTPIWGANADDTVFLPFPQTAGIQGGGVSSVTVNPTNNLLHLFQYFLPFTFKPTGLRWYVTQPGAPALTYYSIGWYKVRALDSEKQLVNSFTKTFPAAGIGGTGYYEETWSGGAAMAPGWYYIGWAKAGSNWRVDGRNVTTQSLYMIEEVSGGVPAHTGYPGAPIFIGSDNVGCSGNAVLPATVTTPLGVLPLNESDPLWLVFMGKST